MRYKVFGYTDIGISRPSNQDSVLIKHIENGKKEIVLAVICDGMGGLQKGELASATVIRYFLSWFDGIKPKELCHIKKEDIVTQWETILMQLNDRIRVYGCSMGITLGTTFTGILFFDDTYVIGHVGDSRAYFIGKEVKQLTTDHTLVQWETQQGKLTIEEAKRDPRRNILLQCVGASAQIHPQILTGKVQKGVYFLCSDGFFHEISSEELLDAFSYENMRNQKCMQVRAKEMVELAKKRREKDNISVALIAVRDDFRL